MSLAILGFVLAGAIYIPSLYFLGDAVFDTDWAVEDCTGIGCFFSTVGAALESIVDLLQFLSLTGLDSTQVDGTFLGVLRFALGLVWLVIIIGFVRGSNQS